MPVSVPAHLDGSGFEGGEPMMMMLRCSVLVVILVMAVVVKMDLREARTVTVVQSVNIMLFASSGFARRHDAPHRAHFVFALVR